VSTLNLGPSFLHGSRQHSNGSDHTPQDLLRCRANAAPTASAGQGPQWIPRPPRERAARRWLGRSVRRTPPSEWRTARGRAAPLPRGNYRGRRRRQKVTEGRRAAAEWYGAEWAWHGPRPGASLQALYIPGWRKLLSKGQAPAPIKVLRRAIYLIFFKFSKQINYFYP
jgi:hypothetical protein